MNARGTPGSHPPLGLHTYAPHHGLPPPDWGGGMVPMQECFGSAPMPSTDHQRFMQANAADLMGAAAAVHHHHLQPPFHARFQPPPIPGNPFTLSYPTPGMFPKDPYYSGLGTFPPGPMHGGPTAGSTPLLTPSEQQQQQLLQRTVRGLAEFPSPSLPLPALFNPMTGMPLMVPPPTSMPMTTFPGPDPRAGPMVSVKVDEDVLVSQGQNSSLSSVSAPGAAVGPTVGPSASALSTTKTTNGRKRARSFTSLTPPPVPPSPPPANLSPPPQHMQLAQRYPGDPDSAAFGYAMPPPPLPVGQQSPPAREDTPPLPAHAFQQGQDHHRHPQHPEPLHQHPHRDHHHHNHHQHHQHSPQQQSTDPHFDFAAQQAGPSGLIQAHHAAATAAAAAYSYLPHPVYAHPHHFQMLDDLQHYPHAAFQPSHTFFATMPTGDKPGRPRKRAARQPSRNASTDMRTGTTGGRSRRKPSQGRLARSKLTQEELREYWRKEKTKQRIRKKERMWGVTNAGFTTDKQYQAIEALCKLHESKVPARLTPTPEEASLVEEVRVQVQLKAEAELRQGHSDGWVSAKEIQGASSSSSSSSCSGTESSSTHPDEFRGSALHELQQHQFQLHLEAQKKHRLTDEENTTKCPAADVRVDA